MDARHRCEIGEAVMKRVGAVVGGAVATAGLLAVGVSPVLAQPGHRHSAAYEQAYEIGLDAYVYGLPLLTTNQTFRSMTSVPVSEGAFGPVNHFNNVRSANTAGSTAVVAPGSTSLSSIAWLDLGDEPQVVHVPRVVGHDYVLAFIDPYTENVVNLSNASNTKPGDYVVRDRSQRHAVLPKGTHAIDVDYSRIWIIGSTELKGPDDVATVNAIQDGYTVTPLSAYASATPTPTPSTPATPPTPTDYPIPTGLAYFDLLGQLLQRFPAPTRDAAALREFATVGIGPGKTPSTDARLSADTRRGLAAAVAAGPARVGRDAKSLTKASAASHNGYLLGGFGRYGTDYTERAVISQIGLGAFVAHQATYAMTWSDRAGTALNGSKNYVLRLPAAPPSRQGWSVTVYNLQGALMSNSLDRHALTSSSPLSRNADGTIDIYLQPSVPASTAKQANWLPVTAGQGFEVMWRLFAPKPSHIDGILDGDGWQPPAVIAKQ